MTSPVASPYRNKLRVVEPSGETMPWLLRQSNLVRWFVLFGILTWVFSAGAGHRHWVAAVSQVAVAGIAWLLGTTGPLTREPHLRILCFLLRGCALVSALGAIQPWFDPDPGAQPLEVATRIASNLSMPLVALLMAGLARQLGSHGVSRGARWSAGLLASQALVVWLDAFSPSWDLLFLLVGLGAVGLFLYSALGLGYAIRTSSNELQVLRGEDGRCFARLYTLRSGAVLIEHSDRTEAYASIWEARGALEAMNFDTPDAQDLDALEAAEES